jgi:hypothetical protein
MAYVITRVKDYLEDPNRLGGKEGEKLANELLDAVREGRVRNFVSRKTSGKLYEIPVGYGLKGTRGWKAPRARLIPPTSDRPAVQTRVTGSLRPHSNPPSGLLPMSQTHDPTNTATRLKLTNEVVQAGRLLTRPVQPPSRPAAPPSGNSGNGQKTPSQNGTSASAGPAQPSIADILFEYYSRNNLFGTLRSFPLGSPAALAGLAGETGSALAGDFQDPFAGFSPSDEFLSPGADAFSAGADGLSVFV